MSNEVAHDEIAHPSGSATSNNSENWQPTPGRSSKKQIRRRRSLYQTDDIIREKSPSPTLPENTSESVTSDGHVKDGGENQQPTVVANGKRTVQCNICKRLVVESKLASHIRLLHVENEPDETDGKKKNFRCDRCGKFYAIKYTYQQHIKTHIEGRPKCPECGSTFASAFSLFRHRAKSHNLAHNYQTHACEQCNKSFFSVSELKLHQQRHSTSRDYECTECKKTFSVQSNLRIHMRTHVKLKLYKCDICECSFSHPYSLVSHRRIHTNDFPFKCSVCDKVYRSKHQLKSHSNVHSDERPFACDGCAKTFRSRTAFKMHQDEHKGIKRFVCKVCDRQFQCLANKLKHERRHSGLKQHKCETCERAFFEKQELRNHMKVHEKPGLNANKSAAEAAATTESEKDATKTLPSDL